MCDCDETIQPRLEPRGMYAPCWVIDGLGITLDHQRFERVDGMVNMNDTSYQAPLIGQSASAKLLYVLGGPSVWTVRLI